MTKLSLKPTHKSVQSYYSQLKTFGDLGATNEGSLAPLFGELLKYCGRQFDYTLIEQYSMKRHGKTIRVDGALIDRFNLPHGVWEAKDSADRLEDEIKKKFAVGYPSENILFQAPEHIIIFQNGREVFNEPIINPQFLICALKIFFEDYQPKEFLDWEKSAEEFKDRIPELGQKLLRQIEAERGRNPSFIAAFNEFYDLCRQTINPGLSVQAVEEMLIQHLLTERIFSNVFRNADFVRRNIIASEIEKVILALTSAYFSRDEFLRDLDRFYVAIETTANRLVDYSEKQHFLNTIYERFFQGFSVKVADTHGIVYTPQPIVDFMVRSVEDILQKEFGKSLSDSGVHILDPFVGTGNFIVRVMREIKRHKLLFKYQNELHCNEVMLLPYYIASMNIEHTYAELAGSYVPFEGICLVDTFELAEPDQTSHLDMLFSKENTARVQKQKEAPIFVIIGNPPYNAGQVNENDNNKNRKYPEIDSRVASTYAKDSKARNKVALSDTYVKAFRLATDRIKQTGEGIVAFVSNNSFINEIAFDGMRKNLRDEFDSIYMLDLGGNVRKNPKLSGTTHNVFGIQVSVSINLLIKKKLDATHHGCRIFYARLDEYWKKGQKYEFLDAKECCERVEWQEITPDKNNNWLTAGMAEEFDGFLPMGTKEAKAGVEGNACFEMFSNGVKTNRDPWTYNFNAEALSMNIKGLIENYNLSLSRWIHLDGRSSIDDLATDDEMGISWSEGLKNVLRRQIPLEYDEHSLRVSLYRPFAKQSLYFDKYFNERQYQFPRLFPTSASERENRIISLSGVGHDVFFCLAQNHITNNKFTIMGNGGSQCFPFYTYAEAEPGRKGARPCAPTGGEGAYVRKENITDWAVEQFRKHYDDPKITKWDIFYYIYAILHHPEYRSKYAANLRRSLPRIPFAPDCRGFAKAGEKLADLHVNYEDQPEYKLEFVENPKAQLNWRVEKMKLSKDKTAIIYNDFLALSGIPPEVFEYMLGNRNALHWVIDQYQVSTDKRSGIVNDPNNPDDPQYIVRLIGKVITVSLETVKVVRDLPPLS